MFALSACSKSFPVYMCEKCDHIYTTSLEERENPISRPWEEKGRVWQRQSRFFYERKICLSQLAGSFSAQPTTPQFWGCLIKEHLGCMGVYMFESKGGCQLRSKYLPWWLLILLSDQKEVNISHIASQHHCVSRTGERRGRSKTRLGHQTQFVFKKQT